MSVFESSPKHTEEPVRSPARFLNHGSFGAYATALEQLDDWASTAANAGYALSTLAAWITVGQKVRVQLATRVYWQPLTPRGQARDALRAHDTQDLLCLVFQKGHVETFRLADLLRAAGADDTAADEARHQDNGMSGAA